MLQENKLIKSVTEIKKLQDFHNSTRSRQVRG